jgi:Cytochrome P460
MLDFTEPVRGYRPPCGVRGYSLLPPLYFLVRQPLEHVGFSGAQVRKDDRRHELEGTEFMIKDSRKYAETGWGFAQFNDGEPTNLVHKPRFALPQDRPSARLRFQ